MLKSIFKAALVAGALWLPLAAHAAGLGKLTVISSLGQPLRAEIDLVVGQQEELATLAARIAPREMFRLANIEYASMLSGIKLSIEKRSNGQPYLKLVSTQPINEPFLDMLVELNWAAGRLVREYTALLDPPGYGPAEPEAVVAQPLSAEVVALPEVQEAVPQQEAVVAEEEAPIQQAEETVAPPRPVAAPKPKQYGPVKRGDTLRKIAASVQPEGVSLDQVLVGLYRDNKQAFDGNNMNRLKVGKILRVPESDQLVAIGSGEAKKEIHTHVVDWNAYRQKLAAAADAALEAPAKQAVAGKLATTVGEQAAAAKAQPQEVLKLSKGEPPGGAAPKDAKAMQERLRHLEEEAVAREKALQESNQRVVQLEKNIQDMQRLLNLKNQGMADLQQQAAAKPAAPAAEAAKAVLAEAPAAVAVPAAESAPVAAETQVQPAAKKAPSPVPAPPAPALLDQILGEPLYLAAGAGVIVLLAALGLVAVRRQRAAAEQSLPSATSIAGIGVGIGAYETQTATGKMKAMQAADEVDPLAEAEVYIAYGRDAQAEQILREALDTAPQRAELRLKLLEIYFNRKDTAAFGNQAHQLATLTGEQGEDWLKAARMGYAIDPQNPLYAAGSAAEGELPMAAAPASAAHLDIGAIDLDLTVPPAAPAQAMAEAAPGAAVEAESAAAAEVAAAVAEVEAAAQAAALGEATQSAANVDFNLEAPSAAAAPPDIPLEAAPQQESNAIDFDFDLKLPEAAPAAPAESQPAIAAPAAPLELSMDFDLGNAPAAEPAAPGLTLDSGAAEPKPAPQPAVDFSAIDLSLDESAAKPAAPATKDEHWYDVQTKFDLAKAYQEMGDKDGAREILQEVMQEGDAEQQGAAKALLDSIA